MEYGDAEAVAVVRHGYNRLSDRYRSDDAEPAGYTPWLDRLLAGLAPGSRVLDLGCGNGIPVARRLTAAGHWVTGVDVSDRQVERARVLVPPPATFVQADMCSCDLGEGCFEAVVALYSLIHVPIARQPALIRRIAAALVPEGALLATVGWDAWTGSDPAWLGGDAEMWWSHADRDTYRRWFEEAGLRVDGLSLVPEGSSGHALIWARRESSHPGDAPPAGSP